MKLLIGSHVSFRKNKQLFGSTVEAIGYGANTFMIYTGAPQNTQRFNIDNIITQKAYKLMEKYQIDIKDLVVHAPYIINLGNNANIEAYDFSINFLKEEIKRVEKLGINKIVIHPGSHVKLGINEGIKNIIKALNKVINQHQKVIICLETMSGKGSECGSNFSELKMIYDGIIYKDKIGFCFDTCHLHDAGYDLTNFNEILDDFDRIIGLDKLKLIHINDSKNEIGAKKDRHENIGYGYIGFHNIIDIIYNPRLKDIPKILETPYITEVNNSNNKLYPPYKFEIEMIKNKNFNKNLVQDIRNYYEKQNN